MWRITRATEPGAAVKDLCPTPDNALGVPDFFYRTELDCGYGYARDRKCLPVCLPSIALLQAPLLNDHPS